MFDVSLISFSPTGSTFRVAQTIANEWGKRHQHIDLTSSNLTQTVCQSPLAVIAMPVYAGRVPTVAIERLREISSRGAKAVTVVVYGNRAYEDALLELNDEVEDLGFEIVGSAAIVAQHSVVSALANGRPNEADNESIRHFAHSVVTKLSQNEKASISVPGNRPYREGMKAPLTPMVTEQCLGCRACVTQCPTQAISMIDPKVTDLSKCILCMRCVVTCPMRARVLPEPFMEVMQLKLSAFVSVHRENEFFI